MKKVLITVLALLCMLSFHAKGQSSAGVKADANLSAFWINEATHLKSSIKTGGSAGFFYKHTRHENRAIEVDLVFRYRTSEIERQTTGEKGDYSYFGIELPLFSTIQAEIDNQIIYLGLGPFASYGMFSRYLSDNQNYNLYKKNQSGDKSIMHRWDFGVGFIVGFELKCRLQFNLNYQMGVRNLVDEGFEGVNMISQLVSFGVGYRF